MRILAQYTQKIEEIRQFHQDKTPVEDIHSLIVNHM